MSEYTTNLNLFKYTNSDYNQVFDFQTALNDNWDKLDLVINNHNQASNTINTLTGYTKPSVTSAISTSDSLNSALGKLEKALDSVGAITIDYEV